MAGASAGVTDPRQWKFSTVAESQNFCAGLWHSRRSG